MDRNANESMTERGNSKESRAISGSFHNQNTTRHPRQDTLLPQSKRKFTSRQPQTGQSPDKLALVNKIEELKVRLLEGENMSKTLGMQLQLTREKLRVRESEQATLEDRLQVLGREIEARQKAERELL